MIPIPAESDRPREHGGTSSTDPAGGGHDINQVLEWLEGQTITLWVADEPFNTLE